MTDPPIETEYPIRGGGFGRRPIHRSVGVGGAPEVIQRRPGVAREPALPRSTDIQLPGEGGLRRAVSSARKRKEEAPSERYTILSREGRQRHPFASAVVAASLYGSQAADVLHQRGLQEAEEERRRADDEERRELRRLRQEAMTAPAPEGYQRDQATGQLVRIPERKAVPSQEERERMRRSGYEWSESTGDWKAIRGGEEKIDKWANEPPPGVTVPPGYQWVPGKGLEKITKEKDERRTRHQIETSIRAGAGQRKALVAALKVQKERAALLRQTAGNYRPGSKEHRDAMLLAAEAEAIAQQTEAGLAEVDARIEGDYGELQEYLPEKSGFTWEDYNEMSPEEQALFREMFRMPPGRRPPKEKSPGEILAGMSP